MWKFLAWIGLNIVAVAIAAVVFYAFPTVAFRDNFVGNWLATVIGVIVGVPVAIELNNWQQRREESQRRSKILALLKNELEYNLSAMKLRMTEYTGGTQRQTPTDPLKNELWMTFSDGGELQWIKDLDLLDVISTAYYRIKIVMFLEDAFHRETLFRDTLGSFKMLEYQFFKVDPVLRDSVQRALDEIQRRLPERSKKVA